MPKSNVPSRVIEELNRQLNHELSAAHAYLAMAVWCDVGNFAGFARYFRKQADEERAHAARMIAHLVDRNVTPTLAALPAPPQELESLAEVAQQALAMEQANTQGINSVYEAALEARDYPAQVLMHWFIKEQVEEEAWATEMVERVQSASCAGSLSDLDRHIERYLGDEAKDGS